MRLIRLPAIYFMLAGIVFAAADTHYVSLTGTNNSPYTNWAGAATNIEWAVNAATALDTVLISNGTYCLTNRILVTNSITIRSFSDNYANVVISGNSTTRCFRVEETAGSAVIKSLTISNGWVSSSDGGAGIVMFAGTVTNCYFTGNKYCLYGSGVRQLGGLVTDCLFEKNSSARYGCVYVEATASRVKNCRFIANTNNSSAYSTLTIRAGSAENCLVISNYGNGVEFTGAFPGTLTYSEVRNNTSDGIYLGSDVTGSTVKNCLIVSNGTRGVEVYKYGIVENCTIAGNPNGIVASGADVVNAQFRNTIIWNNTTTNWSADQGKASFTNCCTTPPVTNGTGNIDAPPLFQNAAAGNFRLTGPSSCINAGINQNWMTNAVDLDGRIRIRYGAVDMGAYEGIYEGTIYRIP